MRVIEEAKNKLLNTLYFMFDSLYIPVQRQQESSIKISMILDALSLVIDPSRITVVGMSRVEPHVTEGCVFHLDHTKAIVLMEKWSTKNDLRLTEKFGIVVFDDITMQNVPISIIECTCFDSQIEKFITLLDNA